MKNVMQCEKKDLYSNISNPKHIKMQSQADNFRIVEERKTQNYHPHTETSISDLEYQIFVISTVFHL